MILFRLLIALTDEKDCYLPRADCRVDPSLIIRMLFLSPFIELLLVCSSKLKQAFAAFNLILDLITLFSRFFSSIFGVASASFG